MADAARPPEAAPLNPTVEYVLKYHQGNLKGRGEFIRLMLEDAGAPYTDDDDGLYQWCDAFAAGAGVPPDGVNTPVMYPPVLIHRKPSSSGSSGQVVVQNTPAVMMYLGRQLGYSPVDEAARALADTVTLNCTDMAGEACEAFHPLDHKATYLSQKEAADKSAAKWAEGRLPVWLKYLEKALSVSDSPFVVAGAPAGPSYADFALFHVLDGAQVQFPETCDRMKAELPRLWQHHAMMSSRPRLQEYFASSRRRPWAGDSMM